jgi:predicted patatin/cPLA2 family phospholipase
VDAVTLAASVPRGDRRDVRVRPSTEVTSPVLRILLDRAAIGSRPGRRDDDAVLALAIEGGGMRGAVSAGMGVALEAAGLVGAFDRIYGVSAGALNAWALSAGQAALGATLYRDAACRKVINRIRPLIGRPVVDFDALFGEMIGARKPLRMPPAGGPEVRVLAASMDSGELRVLDRFSDAAELLQAVRASAALPRLGGEPPVWRGERMVDGSMIDGIPYDAALRQGATPVLVLRSRPAAYRKPRRQALGEELLLRDDPALVAIVRERRHAYNELAGALGSSL